MTRDLQKRDVFTCPVCGGELAASDAEICLSCDIRNPYTLPYDSSVIGQPEETPR